MLGLHASDEQRGRHDLIEREFDITIRRKVTLFKNQLLTNLDHDFVVL